MKKGTVLALIIIAVLFAGLIFTRGSGLSPFSPENTTDPAVEDVNIAQVSEITLSISSPKNGSNISSSSVAVSGKTAPYAEVFLNDLSTSANGQGNFSINVPLEEGQNEIMVTANDARGRAAEKVVTVNYEPKN